MQVQSVGGKDLLEKEMAARSSTLACRIPWTGAWRLQSMGSDMTEQLNRHSQTSETEEKA